VGLETAVLKCIDGIKLSLRGKKLDYRVICGFGKSCFEMYKRNKIVVVREGTGLQSELWGWKELC